jgi:hypothetical protein
MRMFHFLVAATLAASALFGAPDQIDTVFQHAGNDSLGGAFSYALHDRMERSTLYRFTSDARNSMRPAKVEVELVSINVGTPRSGLVSTVSLVAIVKCGSGPRIAHHSLILVSPDNLEKMVKAALAEMDEHIVEEMSLGCRPSSTQEVATTPGEHSTPVEAVISAQDDRRLQPVSPASLLRPAAATAVDDSHP